MRRSRTAAKDRLAREAEETAARERSIQQAIDRKERTGSKQGRKEKSMQAGAREYPAPPLPEQHLEKPGLESALDPAPMYDAPDYRGSGKLLDKVALITGADSGIGRAVAVLFARKGPMSPPVISTSTRTPRKPVARSRRKDAGAS